MQQTNTYLIYLSYYDDFRDIVDIFVGLFSISFSITYTQYPANFIIISKKCEHFEYFFFFKKLHDSPRSRASRFPVFLVGNSQIWINSSISLNIIVDFCKVFSFFLIHVYWFFVAWL